jgi:tripartite-type tricarboxylate transporter receptor subunit TctC
MRPILRPFLVVLILAFLAPLAAPPARAADFPQKAVRIIIGFTAGGGADSNLRLIAAGLSTDLNQSVIVENRPGASGLIAAQVVAASAPDGYTLLFASTGLAVESAKPNPQLDIRKRFVPVLLTGTVDYVVYVPPSLPVKTMPELIAYAKAHPGQMNYASVGVGTAGHLGMEVLKRMLGFEATHVPFKSTGETTLAVASGRVQIGLDPPTAVAPLAEAGKLRMIAIAAAKRAPLYPNLPSFEEQGITGIGIASWVGIMAPTGTPPAAVTRLNEGLNVSIKKPEVQAALLRSGYHIIGGPPDELTRQLDREIPVWARAIREGNIEFD